jgi:phosphoribosyl 1,2-cyclic phosphodiesterase
VNLSLFQRDIIVAPLGSGSRGNCTYIGDGYAGVLIDCGLSSLQVFKRMEAVGLQDSTIDAVLITHEHSDHVGGARVLAKRLTKRQGAAVPFYMTEGTRQGVRPQCMPEGVETVEAGDSLRVAHFLAECFPVPHDTRDPVAWRVQVGGRWAGVITDLGRPTALVSQKLRELSVAVLEFNHDEDALFAGSYPWQLKQRIRSSHGHLSNAQAAQLLQDSLGDELEHVVLAHLSGENNRPELAVAAAQGALDRAGADHVSVAVANQSTAIPPCRVEVQGW